MSKKAAATAGRGAKRSSPRARATTARATAQAIPILVVTSPSPSSAAAAVQSEQKVDEAQVQAAFGAHAHHGNADDDTVADLSLAMTATTTIPTTAGGSAVVASNDAASLQALAQQQDEYQRKLKQLQQQHELQQQQKMKEQAERQDRMQQIQQKLHERIQLKQLHDSGTSSPVASAVAGQTQATQQLRQAIIQREENEMTQSLAEHQMQLYKAMMRDLDMQSGIPMTPLPSPAIPGGGNGGIETELIPAPILPGTTSLDVMTTKAYEDFQRARQEQQLRLQQYQQIQHAAATGGSGSPSIVRTQAPASNDLVRQQMMIEQERLRVLQAQEMQQQHQQQHQVAHSRGPQVSAQEQLLIQQHDILRQQQILQNLLQRQQLERQQQTAAAARSQPQQQQQQQKASAAKKIAATASVISSSGEGVLPPPAKKRKKAATSPESQMEALVRELIRLSNAGNAIEVRTSLDKMTAWVHRSFDAELLKFAQRDFRDIVLAKRPSLMQANQWTSDIQVKCEYIIEKIAQVIMAVSVQHPGKAADGATSTTAAAASSVDQANAIRLAAKEHAYAALKAQMMQQQKGKGGAAAVKASAQAAKSSDTKKQPLFVDLSLINSKQKAAASSANPQPQTEASTSSGTDAASAIDVKPTATTTSTAVPVSTKVVTATPLAPKSVSSSTPLASAPAAPLSPQLVQQLYEVDLTSRNCAVNEEEGEDKLYIPVKSIAKVMRRALPDDPGASQVPAKGGKKGSGSTETADAIVKTEDMSATTEETHVTKVGQVNDGDEEMKTGDDEEEAKTSSSTPVASISLAALALQKRLELVERNLQQSGQAPIKIDDDAVAFMQECVTEFILYLTSEAKDHWSIDKKKTNSLLGSHVVQGMDNLGFSTYARVLDTFNGKIKKVQDAQSQKRVEKKLQDKKLKQQQKLLEVAEAKARAAAAAAAAAAANASAELGGAEAQAVAGSVTTTALATVVTSTTTPETGAAANEASAATTVTTTTVISSPTQQEMELMAREDLGAAQ